MEKSRAKRNEDKVKLMNDIIAAKVFSDETNKTNAIKKSRHNRFYDYGKNWGLQGKDLDEGVANSQKFKFDTEQDIIDFKTGYISARYYRLGFDMGFEGLEIENVPTQYLKTDSVDRLELQKISLFKKGYEDGFKQFSKISDSFFKLGENGEMLDRLPDEFRQNRKFIFSYVDGLKLYQERENSQFHKNVR